jgi:predicted MPP superfamily phosphohydrolase
MEECPTRVNSLAPIHLATQAQVASRYDLFAGLWRRTACISWREIMSNLETTANVWMPFAAAGVRVLSNEMLEVDGLQIVGVPYRNAAHDGQLASVLDGIRLDRDRASVLLTHAPDHPEIAEAAGVSLQLSGHTHLGQFVPWTWMARRIYRQFVYGLSRIGGMQLFTSSGAGTWGPPLRLGSNPEIVMLEFR